MPRHARVGCRAARVVGGRGAGKVAAVQDPNKQLPNQGPLPVIPTPRGIGELLLENLGVIRSLLGGAGGIVAAIIIAKLLPGEKIETWMVALGGFIAFWLILACIRAILASLKDARAIRGAAVQERPEVRARAG